MDTSVADYKWSKEVKHIWDNKCAFCGKSVFAGKKTKKLPNGSWHIEPPDRLEAHHMIPRCKAPELANDLTNGIALCHECHLRAHGGSYYGTSMDWIYSEHINPKDKEVIDFIEQTIVLLVPKGQKKAIETCAKSKGKSIDSFMADLVKAEMGLTDDEWKNPKTDQ